MELKAVYHWGWKGKIGEDSLAGRLAWENRDRKFTLEGPITELWAATHRDGPASLRCTGQSLKEYLKSNPTVCGDSEDDGIMGLPFIYRVLSIRVPTNIRCHPEKQDNKRIKKMCPDLFPDRAVNELIIISNGYSLVSIGIRPSSEIKKFLKRIPELTCFIPMDVCLKYMKEKKPKINEILLYLFNSSELERQLAIDILISRLEKLDPFIENAFEYYLCMKIHVLLPYDVGIFIPFFFNCKFLMPGEGIYIAPRTPFTLLMGDFISVSSKSTNVLRVGMACDFPDTNKFLEAADLSYQERYTKIIPVKLIDLCVQEYKLLPSKLVIHRIALPKGVEHELHTLKQCSVLHVIKGHIKTYDFQQMKLGSIILLPANSFFHFKVNEDTIFYRAYYESTENIRNSTA